MLRWRRLRSRKRQGDRIRPRPFRRQRRSLTRLVTGAPVDEYNSSPSGEAMAAENMDEGHRCNRGAGRGARPPGRASTPRWAHAPSAETPMGLRRAAPQAASAEGARVGRGPAPTRPRLPGHRVARSARGARNRAQATTLGGVIGAGEDDRLFEGEQATTLSCLVENRAPEALQIGLVLGERSRGRCPGLVVGCGFDGAP